MKRVGVRRRSPLRRGQIHRTPRSDRLLRCIENIVHLHLDLDQVHEGASHEVYFQSGVWRKEDEREFGGPFLDRVKGDHP